jgi:diguanylate cyclase (GGDEF)-like protein/PAS domain S-box-containing protein
MPLTTASLERLPWRSGLIGLGLALFGTGSVMAWVPAPIGRELLWIMVIAVILTGLTMMAWVEMQVRALRRALSKRGELVEGQSQSLRRMGAVLRTAPIGIALIRQERFEMVSHYWAALLGYRIEEILRMAPQSLLQQPELAPLIRTTEANCRGSVGEFEFRRRDGSTFWGRVQVSPADQNDARAGLVWLLTDITQERNERDRLSWMATHDALTGLLNRSAFESMVNCQLKSLRTKPSSKATLLYLDIDHFKTINDTWGHAAGDVVLTGVARLMVQCVRAADVVGRIGGDEFAVLLQGCDLKGATRLADQMRRSVQDSVFSWQGRSLQVEISIGVSLLEERMEDVATALHAADRGLYEAKHNGRNAVRVSGFGEMME